MTNLQQSLVSTLLVAERLGPGLDPASSRCRFKQTWWESHCSNTQTCNETAQLLVAKGCGLE